MHRSHVTDDVRMTQSLISISNLIALCVQIPKIWPSKVTSTQTPLSLQLRLAPLIFEKDVHCPISSNPHQQPSCSLFSSWLDSSVGRGLYRNDRGHGFESKHKVFQSF